jgi:hypothetical protein
VVLAATLVSACGSSGSSSDKNATALINTAFHQPIKSADVNFDLEIQVNGVASLKNPVSVKFSGPYVNNGPGKLPSMDLNASIAGGGQSVPFGITSTGDDFFIKVRNQAYDVGKATVARLNQQLAQQKSKAPQTSLSQLGIHPSTWLAGAKDAGDSTVAGTPVQHVSANLDVGTLLDDLNQLVQRAPAGAISGASKPPQLTDQQKKQIEDVLNNPKIDVYVAKSDNTVRRLATTLEISIPKDQQARFNGATGGTLQLSIELANVGGSQKVKAPAGAKPISALAGQLNALGGSLGGSSSGSGSSTPTPGASGGGTPSAKQFQDYANCIQKAGGNNAAALQKCADILK